MDRDYRLCARSRNMEFRLSKEVAMTCVICKLGETIPGTTTITLEREGLTLVVKNVPAQVCANCGEAYVKEEDSAQILAEAEQMAQSGALVDVRQFTPA
jgi:YgiT-type zinc finger domain-containing protein